MRYSLIMTAVISLALTLLCYIFTKQIIGAFVSGDEAISYGIYFARVILITLWLYCLFTVCSMALQAMGNATASLIVNMSRNAYIFIPILFIMSGLFGMNGIVWSFPISDIICVIIAGVVLLRAIKNCFEESKNNSVDEIPVIEPLSN